jgi:hypothetical protein
MGHHVDWHRIQRRQSRRAGCDRARWNRLHQEEVMALECDNTHYITDLDTPQDVLAFTERTGIELTWPALPSAPK